jgi:hypothetical protein
VGAGTWTIELSGEVESWYLALGIKDRAQADRVFDLLTVEGPMLGMPLSKQLGDGLRELRFSCEGVQRRVTFYLRPEHNAITLTTFRKQRQNERSEVERARKAMRRDRQRRG